MAFDENTRRTVRRFVIHYLKPTDEPLARQIGGVMARLFWITQDYLGRPFGPMPQLMSIAEDVTKMRAICMRCGSPASYTQRLISNRERVVVGAAGAYEARCRQCFDPHLTELTGEENK